MLKHNLHLRLLTRLAMLRYIVRNRRSGATEHLYATLGEAIAAAVRLIDDGPDADVFDAQGSGAIVVGLFDLREAEAHLRQSLGSESFGQPQPLASVLEAARQRHKEKPTTYHWDYGSSDIR
jgi:hypothetical protein